MATICEALPHGKDLTRFAHIPEDLISLPRWIVWKREAREPGGKLTKVPYNAGGGYRASSTKPRTWASYTAALEAYRDGDYAGIGFMLGDGWAGCDLDDCIDEHGVINDWALGIINRLSTYAEISPGGRGVKMICRGALPPGRRRIDKPHKIEVYDRARMFTVTGREWRAGQ